MPFSRNPDLVRQRAALVADLKSGGASIWRVPPNPQDTQKYAQQIRETLFIASLYPDQFPELAAAHKNFAIHVVGPGLIEAKLKPNADGTTGQAPWGKEQHTVELSTAHDIAEAWQKHLPSSDPLKFENHQLSPDELKLLYKWCNDRTPKLMMLVTNTGHLTLALREPGSESYSWHPPGEAPKEEPEYDV